MASENERDSESTNPLPLFFNYGNSRRAMQAAETIHTLPQLRAPSRSSRFQLLQLVNQAITEKTRPDFQTPR